MKKKFRFKRFMNTRDKIQVGTEMDIKNIDGVDYVMDGCFAIFELDSDMAREYGEVVERLF